MTALLTRLRIAGFKSFAEPAALDILPGLTGIVGPNGCGKSNVVEALRWAMGESSARSLRGGEMDDVIFAGTAARSSRNLAEVSITLQRGADALPDPFGAEEEVQVTRRIERGAGSQYRANGRDMRARDVQTLFADLASGAKSSAMVSQGRVSALVNARPEERRAVLEEAAGITGLHARRHEAELKLRAADANLARAEELRTQLETGREGLRRQARQASRYRNIAGAVRAAEADFLAVLHARAYFLAEQAQAAQAQARDDADRAQRAVQREAAALEAAEAALPGPRAEEAEARSLLERRRLEAETLAEEAARADRALQAALAQSALIQSDLTHAAAVEADAAGVLDGLAAQADQLRDRLAALPAEIEAAETALRAALEAAADAESQAESAASRAVEAASAARQAAVSRDQAARRLAEALHGLETAEALRDAARDAEIDPAILSQAAASAADAETALADARAAEEHAALHRQSCVLEAGEARATLARETERAATHRKQRAEAESRLARLEAAHALVTRELEGAIAAQLAPARLDAARAALGEARSQALVAEDAAEAAELAHTNAGAARLQALTVRDQLRAAHARLLATRADAAARHERQQRDFTARAEALAAAEQAQPAEAALTAARGSTEAAERAATLAASSLERCAAARSRAEQALNEARSAASSGSAFLAGLVAEADGVRRALGDGHAQAAPLLDEVELPAGLEAAFGAVFADADAAPESADAMRFWRALPPVAAAHLPAGCTSLADLVRAPAALGRALSHAALLPDGADGDARQAALPPGWVLVSQQGDVWRWDGQVSRAGAPNAASARLKLRGRLRELDTALGLAREQDEAGRIAAAAAEAACATARANEATARGDAAAAEGVLAECRRAQAALDAEADGVAAHLASLRPAVSRAETDLRTAEAMLADEDAALAALPDPGTAERALSAASMAAEAARLELSAARAARDAARGAADTATASLRALEAAATRSQDQLAALHPQIERLGVELREAEAARAALRDEEAALPDMAALSAREAAAQESLAGATVGSEAARQAVARAETARQETAAMASRLAREATEARLALASAESVLQAAASAAARAQAETDAAQTALAALPDAAALAEAAVRARLALNQARARQAAAAARQAALNAERVDAVARLASLDADLSAWAVRRDEAARRHAALAVRVLAAQGECEALEQAPRLLAAREQAFGATLAQAQSRHEEAAAALLCAEEALREASRAQRAAEAAQSACREMLARGEGAAETAQAGLRAVLERAAERLGPEAVLPAIALPEGAGEAEEERARRKLERLQRERDEMGPVNLRADLELDEIDARIAAIEAERDELTTAIARLRGGIGHLNREGRERLAAVFTQVDTHFRALFTRMMGGGRAHLALTGSDDPLEAGLEIYAEPPGKKLASLSLLSGGEQALTALSLIFAVFRCTPAPVAVLDEVDAPLDDVNVDRFCGLLEDVVRDTGTRFLVVTHHQLTMSRMDRLFGVTMQERGVSRLLSVDLRRAAEMVEPVMQAAE